MSALDIVVLVVGVFLIGWSIGVMSATAKMNRRR